MRAALFALLGALPLAALADPPATPDSRCLECHNLPALRTVRDRRVVSLYADPAALARSAHGSLACVDCHEGLDASRLPHRAAPVAVNCVGCHDDAAAKHAFHVRLGLTPTPAGADTSCTGCHGTHAIAETASPDFAFAGPRQAQACGACHRTAAAQFGASAHARPFDGVPTPTCLTCHASPVAPAAGHPADVALKLRQTALCESCHVKNSAVGRETVRGATFVASFERSVHGAALHRGAAGAPNCIDCHGAHEMNDAMAPGARTGKARAAQTCGACHRREAAEYGASVHAQALARGAIDAPTCTDCHGEHDILAPQDPASPVYSRNLAQQVCARCHASLPLTAKFGLSSAVFQTFSDSYHGLAEREGAVAVANCASCHGAHAIRASSDPASPTNPANLARTCGQCHQGANARFAFGKVHIDPATGQGVDGGSRAIQIIATIYVVLIVGVIGGMFVHNALDFLKKVRRKLAIQQGIVAEAPAPHRLYLRMTAHERIQHAALVLTFTILVITGFMLHYPDAWWVAGIRHCSATVFDFRGLIHRVAGVAMIATALWHAGYVRFTRAGRDLFRALLPRRRDFTDPWKVVRYNLGLAPDKPQFERFCYIEKAEYWAVLWGTIVMGLTGAVLWFDNLSMGLLTKLGLDISRTIHFYEAILASLAIVVWHFYWVIYNPDVYPMNLAWLTGRMSEKEMAEEHPLDLPRLRDGKPAAADGQPGDASQ